MITQPDPTDPEFEALVLDIVAAENLPYRAAALRALELLPILAAGQWQPEPTDRYVPIDHRRIRTA